MAGFFARIGNLWRGFLSLFIADLEVRNPEAVYEAAIDERVNKYHELKKAVSGIIHLRDKHQRTYDEQRAQLAQVNREIPVAVEQGDEEVALLLLEKKNELESSMAALETELDTVRAQADTAKQGLISFQAEIKKLQGEKTAMLAKKSNAEARLKIQDQLSGISTEADVKALNNVRESIDKLHSEANTSEEISGSSLDARLAAIRGKTGNAQARNQLEQLKKQMAAKKASAAATQKTI